MDKVTLKLFYFILIKVSGGNVFDKNDQVYLMQ